MREALDIPTSTDNILSHFGIDHAAFLGSGSEATVYDLGNGTVLRLHKSGSQTIDRLERTKLLSKLALIQGEHCFQIPKVIDHGDVFGFQFTLEERLEGQTMTEALSFNSGSQRESLIENYMETATKLGSLCIPTQTLYGEFAKAGGLMNKTFKGFLHDHAAATARQNKLFIDAETLVSPFVEPDKPELMHLDYYPANVLCECGKVTAVLDFGSTSLLGCGSFNPAIALAFLDPKIAPSVNQSGYELASDWLLQQSTMSHFTAVRAWLAVYWSFCDAEEDPDLYRWCRDILDL